MREIPIENGMVEGWKPGSGAEKPKSKWSKDGPPASEVDEGIAAAAEKSAEQLKREIEETGNN